MYIGVDIGGTKILVAASDADLNLIDSRKVASPQDSSSALSEIVELIKTLSQGQDLKSIGIAAPGPLDFNKGALLNPPNLTWHNFDIVDALKNTFKVPVVIENDANSGGLAEAVLGAAKGHETVLYVTISTGIGTGVVINGDIYHGTHDVEGGHMTIDPAGPICGCGGRGHFEAIASGQAIKTRFGKIAADITDPETWDIIGKDLANGLGNMITFISPDIVVLGGGVSVHHQHFLQPLIKHLEEHHTLYPLPKILPAKNVETAAVYGALILAQRAAPAINNQQ